MASRPTKASKRQGSQEAGPSTSSEPPKKVKKTQTSKEEKKAAAKDKEELRLHQAIERSIQKAIREASIREALIQPGTPPTQIPLAPQASEMAQGDPPAAEAQVSRPLSPDGDQGPPAPQGEVCEALFGAQSETSL